MPLGDAAPAGARARLIHAAMHDPSMYDSSAAEPRHFAWSPPPPDRCASIRAEVLDQPCPDRLAKARQRVPAFCGHKAVVAAARRVPNGDIREGLAGMLGRDGPDPLHHVAKRAQTVVQPRSSSQSTVGGGSNGTSQGEGSGFQTVQGA